MSMSSVYKSGEKNGVAAAAPFRQVMPDKSLRFETLYLIYSNALCAAIRPKITISATALPPSRFPP